MARTFHHGVRRDDVRPIRRPEQARVALHATLKQYARVTA